MTKRYASYLLDAFSLLLYGGILLLKTYYVEHLPLHRSFWLGTLGAVLFITAFLLLFKQPTRYYVFIVINLLVSILLIADVVYGRYFGDVISISLLRQAKLAAGVRDSVLELIKPRDFAYLIDLIVIIPALWLQRKQSRPAIKGAGIGWVGRIALMAICFLIGNNLVQASAASLQERQPGLIRAVWDKQVVANNIGTLNFHALDFWRFAKRQVNTSRLPWEEQEAIAAWFAEYTATTGSKYHKTMQGKNLILVQLEAFQGFVLNLEINGREVTPNLNRLAQESLTFHNAFYQTAMGGTSDAEFLANVSLFPSKDGTAYYDYSANAFLSLPQMAKAAGYSTAVMHPFRPGFWNRPPMYAALGFDTYLNQEDFTIDEIFGMGLDDHSFYRQAVAEMQTMQQPFYAFLISLSSHFPFTDPKVDLSDRLELGEFNGTLLGNFLLNAHYADEAVGLLIAELEAAGLWDNSLVVFYGDHAAVPPTNNQQLARLLADKDELEEWEWQLAQKVVMMIHLPQGQVRGESQMPVGQIDLFPTLANLLGFETPYTMGRDLLNAESNLICFRNGSWINEEVLYLRTTNQVYDLQTGEVLPLENYQEIMARAEEKLKISDLTLEHDLIRIWLTE